MDAQEQTQQEQTEWEVGGAGQGCRVVAEADPRPGAPLGRMSFSGMAPPPAPPQAGPRLVLLGLCPASGLLWGCGDERHTCLVYVIRITVVLHILGRRTLLSRPGVGGAASCYTAGRARGAAGGRASRQQRAGSGPATAAAGRTDRGAAGHAGGGAGGPREAQGAARGSGACAAPWCEAGAARGEPPRCARPAAVQGEAAKGAAEGPRAWRHMTSCRGRAQPLELYMSLYHVPGTACVR